MLQEMEVFSGRQSTHLGKPLMSCALPLAEEVLHGKNALFFAYGITYSGKTYTMMGESRDPGILPRCMDAIFKNMGELQAKHYMCLNQTR